MPAHAGPLIWSVDEWLPMFVSVWLAGVVLLTLRLFSGWMWVQRMKSHGARPAPEALQSAAHRLMRRLHIGRAVRLLESTSAARADRHRLAEAGRAAAGQRHGRPRAEPDGSHPRARARPHPASRLRRQSFPDRRRNVVVLSPGGVVAVAADSRRAGELLRRSRREPVRRPGGVRSGARRARRAAFDSRRSGARGNRRIAAAAGQAAARRPDTRRPRAGLARGRCCAARPDQHVRRGRNERRVHRRARRSPPLSRRHRRHRWHRRSR